MVMAMMNMLPANMFTLDKKRAQRIVTSLCLTWLCFIPQCSGFPRRLSNNRLTKLRLLSTRLALNRRDVRTHADQNQMYKTTIVPDIQFYFMLLASQDKHHEKGFITEKQDANKMTWGKMVQTRALEGKPITAMDNFKSAYLDFHTELKRFLNNLAGKYISNATKEELSDSVVLLKVLQPSDSVFCTDNAFHLVQRFFIITDVLELLFVKVTSQIQEDDKQWLLKQKNILEYYSVLVKMSIGSLQLGVTVEHVKILSAGVGGINNTGLTTSIRLDILQRVVDLINVLKNLP